MEEFGDRIEPYRAELRVHCYRMLGSLTEAEDVLQETMIAAWRGRDGFEERSSLRTWLYRIATNQCLNARRAASRRVPETPRPPFTPPPPSRLAEVTWLEPFPDTLLEAVPDRAPGPEARYGMREAIELAFVVGLQQLPPRQTAVLILKDVLGYSTGEVASLLDTTATAVKGALQRARATLGEPRPVTPPSSDERALTRRFADAFEVRDIDALVSLLTDDAWLAMPPAPHEYHGIPAVLEFLEVSGAWRGERAMRLEPVRVNRQYAFASYLDGARAGLMVLTLRGGRIAGMTRFLYGLDPAFARASGSVAGAPVARASGFVEE
ncbi:RNA polymerase subunit sigma-70 [Actinoplanes sp. NPDC051411]|uniref:RNA polymerase subunit sigma-70 n=1 Tax=Actinoplanes sp. NPDC051411 TaxID=3155522 RepID=UPI003449299E